MKLYKRRNKMGCDYYNFNDIGIHFSDNSDVSCLCTFPHNYEHNHKLDREIIKSLAMLGAAIALIYHDEENKYKSKYFFLPHGLPEWIEEELNKFL